MATRSHKRHRVCNYVFTDFCCECLANHRTTPYRVHNRYSDQKIKIAFTLLCTKMGYYSPTLSLYLYLSLVLGTYYKKTMALKCLLAYNGYLPTFLLYAYEISFIMLG